MARSAALRVPARDEAVPSDHPYANALKNVSASIRERVLNDDPICTPENDAFARAVKRIGGIKATDERARVSDHYLLEIIFGGVSPDPISCFQVEKTCLGEVKCEEMRTDLMWFRDHAGEVVGCAEPIDATRLDLQAAISSVAAKPDGQRDAITYRAGMLHGVPKQECERLLGDTYSSVQNWSDPDVLDRLLADVDQYRSDSAFHQCYGMLWDFEDADRDRLIAESGVMLSRDWSMAKSDELWAKAQELRAKSPEKSSIAGRALAQGMADVAETAQEIASLVAFHGIDSTKTWTAEAYDDLTEHTRAVVLKSLLSIEPDGVPDWRDILLGQSYGTRSMLDADDAALKGQAAMNLLDQVLPGLAAIHDIQWVAMDSPNAYLLDKRSIRNMAVFLKSMQELVQLLVNLRDNMLYRQRELEG